MLKEDEMMYVPLLDSLQLMLNKQTILHEVRILSHDVCIFAMVLDDA